MQKFGRAIIFASMTVLLAAGCSKVQPQQNNPPLEIPERGTTTPIPAPPVYLPPHATSSANQNPKPTGQTQTIQNAGKPDYTPGYVIVSNTVEGSNLNHQYDKVKDGTSAYDLLASTHQVKAKDYGAGMGEMVLSIDGITPDSSRFWEFLVNGKFSNVGASSYILKDGDSVQWKLETINNNQ